MTKKLLNPFAYINDVKLLIIGFIAHLFFIFIAYYFNYYFPDFISIQKTIINFSFLDILYQNSRNVIIACIILFICGRRINSKTRFIDICNVVLIARIPYYLILLTDFVPIVKEKMNLVTKSVQTNNLVVFQNSSVMVVIMIIAILALLVMVLMFYYLYIGFKTVTNLKTLKQKLGFILSVIIIIFITFVLSVLIPQTIF
ncbi:hypothetical protein [Chishuiella sp.]|uniref:hypothetical protein n=1 Tax=Chishuiella sp. TaxID=1969467 RepID=UPI0028AED6CF|nr:hypothetical protein [Chishuiella sp.]